MTKRYLDAIVFEDGVFKRFCIDTKTGKRSRFYDMENDETDRIQREVYYYEVKHGLRDPVEEGKMTILKEWD